MMITKQKEHACMPPLPQSGPHYTKNPLDIFWHHVDSSTTKKNTYWKPLKHEQIHVHKLNTWGFLKM